MLPKDYVSNEEAHRMIQAVPKEYDELLPLFENFESPRE